MHLKHSVSSLGVSGVLSETKIFCIYVQHIDAELSQLMGRTVTQETTYFFSGTASEESYVVKTQVLY